MASKAVRQALPHGVRMCGRRLYDAMVAGADNGPRQNAPCAFNGCADVGNFLFEQYRLTGSDAWLGRGWRKCTCSAPGQPGPGVNWLPGANKKPHGYEYFIQTKTTPVKWNSFPAIQSQTLAVEWRSIPLAAAGQHQLRGHMYLNVLATRAILTRRQVEGTCSIGPAGERRGYSKFLHADSIETGPNGIVPALPMNRQRCVVARMALHSLGESTGWAILHLRVLAHDKTEKALETYGDGLGGDEVCECKFIHTHPHTHTRTHTHTHTHIDRRHSPFCQLQGWRA